MTKEATIPKTARSLYASLCKELPQRIARVLGDYDQFAAQSEQLAEAKDFAAHHNACKAAVSHMETLAKLLRWAQNERIATKKAKAGPQDDPALALIAEAKKALANETT